MVDIRKILVKNINDISEEIVLKHLVSEDRVVNIFELFYILNAVELIEKGHTFRVLVDDYDNEFRDMLPAHVTVDFSCLKEVSKTKSSEQNEPRHDIFTSIEVEFCCLHLISHVESLLDDNDAECDPADIRRFIKQFVHDLLCAKYPDATAKEIKNDIDVFFGGIKQEKPFVSNAPKR